MTTTTTFHDSKNLVACAMDFAKANAALPCTMQSSAKLCYDKACEIMSDLWTTKAGIIPESIRYWVLRSLSFSVGVFHPDYALAKECLNKAMAGLE